MRSSFLTTVLLVPSMALLACGVRSEEPGEAPANRMEAPGIGIAIADLPAGLTVQSTSGEELVLTPVGQAGRIVIQAAPAGEGTNLVQAVKDHQASIEARPGAQYLGVRELVTPLGSAYWSRGRYEEGGALVEETRIVTLHPSGDRLLRLTYVYPAGDDSGARIQQLLGVVAEVEGLGGQETSAGR